jgi:hypothetical protein
MSGTLDLPKAPFTPRKQIRPADIYASSPDYTPAEKLKIGTPELLAQAKAEQALEEAPRGKGGKRHMTKSRRRKGGKKTRGRRVTKTRRRSRK